MKKTIALAAIAAISGSAMAGSSLVVDVSGIESWDFQGDANNTVLSVLVGAGASITSISWDVSLTTFGLSWADENTMTFNGSQSINVAAGDAFTVSNAPYAGSTGSSLVLDGSGLLNIEFHEVGFDDNPNAVDSVFGQGSTLTIGYVPTPGSLAVLGLGGLVAGRRRR